MPKVFDDYVNSCTLTFKQYDYAVMLNKKKFPTYHFTASKDDKTFAVFCKKIVLENKLDILKENFKEEMRPCLDAKQKPVFVFKTVPEGVQEQANTIGAVVIDIETITEFYQEMLKAKMRADGDELVDQWSAKLK